MKKILSNALLIAGLLSFTVLLGACNKKKDTFAKIYVRDAGKNLVSGCTVKLLGISTEGKQQDVNLEMTTETNASGEAIFNFNDIYKKGQAGVAVLRIEATKGTQTASGIIKVEEETTSEETVYLQP